MTLNHIRPPQQVTALEFGCCDYRVDILTGKQAFHRTRASKQFRFEQPLNLELVQEGNVTSKVGHARRV